MKVVSASLYMATQNMHRLLYGGYRLQAVSKVWQQDNAGSMDGMCPS